MTEAWGQKRGATSASSRAARPGVGAVACGWRREWVQDSRNEQDDAIVTKDHVDGERIRPAIWLPPVLLEGDDLAFDILAVASPNAGSDLTVVIHT